MKRLWFTAVVIMILTTVSPVQATNFFEMYPNNSFPGPLLNPHDGTIVLTSLDGSPSSPDFHSFLAAMGDVIDMSDMDMSPNFLSLFTPMGARG